MIKESFLRWTRKNKWFWIIGIPFSLIGFSWDSLPYSLGRFIGRFIGYTILWIFLVWFFWDRKRERELKKKNKNGESMY